MGNYLDVPKADPQEVYEYWHYILISCRANFLENDKPFIVYLVDMIIMEIEMEQNQSKV